MTKISYDSTDSAVADTVSEMTGVTIDDCAEKNGRTILSVTIHEPFDSPDYPSWYGSSRIDQVKNVISRLASNVTYES